MIRVFLMASGYATPNVELEIDALFDLDPFSHKALSQPGGIEP